MKAIVIPPIKELRNVYHPSGTHLALAHLALGTEQQAAEYWQFFVERKQEGDYIILDNAAHELRVPLDPHELIEAAELVRADEIVLPDVPYDHRQTIKLMVSCMQEWAQAGEDMRPYRLMFVPQGDTILAWRTCLFAQIMRYQRLVREFRGVFSDQQPVVALPAKYEGKFEGYPLSRMIADFLEPLHHHGYEIHLLGWRSLWGLNDIAMRFPFIRSTDSAKPFVYGKKGIVFDPLHEAAPEHVTRPDDFFEWELTPHQRKVSDLNSTVFQGLANGRYKGYCK